MRIVGDVTNLAPHVEEVNFVTFDDPLLFRYPSPTSSSPIGGR